MDRNEEIARLVQQVLDGDSEAFEELYKYTYKSAFFHAKKILKSEEDVEDAVSEAYLRTYQNLDRLSNPAMFQAWINRIVTNISLNMVRDDRYRDSSSLDDEDFFYEPVAPESETPDLVLDRKGTEEIIGSMIEQLPEIQRTTLILYYFDEMSVADIAKMMGCSEGTVKSRLNYARHNIETAVREEEKRGVKLYSLSPVLLLAAIRRLINGMPLQRSMVLGTARTVADSCGYSSSLEAPAEAVGRGTERAVTRPGAAARAGKSRKAAATAAKATAVTKTAAHAGIASKIVAAVLTVTILGGGAVVGMRWHQSPDASGMPKSVQNTDEQMEKTITEWVEGSYDMTVPTQNISVALESTQHASTSPFSLNSRNKQVLETYQNFVRTGSEEKALYTYVNKNADRFLKTRDYQDTTLSNFIFDSFRYALYDIDSDGTAELFCLSSGWADQYAGSSDQQGDGTELLKEHILIKFVGYYTLEDEKIKRKRTYPIYIGAANEAMRVEYSSGGLCLYQMDNNILTRYTCYNAPSSTAMQDWHFMNPIGVDDLTVSITDYNHTAEPQAQLMSHNDSLASSLSLNGWQWESLIGSKRITKIIGFGTVFDEDDLSLSRDEFLALNDYPGHIQNDYEKARDKMINAWRSKMQDSNADNVASGKSEERSFCYAEYDINRDGIKELLIASGSSGYREKKVKAVYAFNGEEMYNMLDGGTVINPYNDGYIIYYNPATKEIVRYEGEADGGTITSFLYDSDQNSFIIMEKYSYKFTDGSMNLTCEVGNMDADTFQKQYGSKPSFRPAEILGALVFHEV